MTASRRAGPTRPPEAGGLIGEYGWDHDVLFIFERLGKLHALIEWFFDYPLEQVEPDIFAFPKSGLYDGEKLIFRRDEKGRASSVVTASVKFDRRPLPGEDGAAFRVKPIRPLADLRTAALAAVRRRRSATSAGPTSSTWRSSTRRSGSTSGMRPMTTSSARPSIRPPTPSSSAPPPRPSCGPTRPSVRPGSAS